MQRPVSHILIADRNPNVLEFLRREFLRQGYRVQVARDGFDLCNALRAKDAPDLVVLDLELPFMDGCGHIDQLGRSYPGLLVVLHYLPRDAPPSSFPGEGWTAVEKGGDPSRLITAVRDLLKSRDTGPAQGDVNRNTGERLKT